VKAPSEETGITQGPAALRVRKVLYTFLAWFALAGLLLADREKTGERETQGKEKWTTRSIITKLPRIK